VGQFWNARLGQICGGGINGKFQTRDGRWCHVLTLEDAFSRFLLRAEALTERNGKNVQRILDGAFQEFGLHWAIRSDHGPPFASTGAGGLTELSVWWLKLGIRLERIEPGKPQQNGRLERFHRNLEEIVGKPAKNAIAQGRAIDYWRHDYNNVRPHEALGMRVPSDSYVRSKRRYPINLVVEMHEAVITTPPCHDAGFGSRARDALPG
jgi:transposase InsO family protein